MSVKALYQSQQDVGRNIKSSKKKYTWKFSIDDKDHTIELFVSALSGKKKVVHNGRVLREEASVLGSFNYSMTLQNNLLTISSNGDLYDLRINNMQFSYLYHNAKTKKEFEWEDDYKKPKNEDDDNNNDYYSKLPKQSKQTKPLYKEKEGDYDMGLVDGFESMAPKTGFQEENEFSTHQNQQQKLNIQFKPKDDAFDKFNPTQPKPQQRQTQSFQPQKNAFSDFGNFGNPNNQPSNDNAFANFGNFGQQFSFDQSKPQQNQEQKPNPFGDFQQPNQQPQNQQQQQYFQSPQQQQQQQQQQYQQQQQPQQQQPQPQQFQQQYQQQQPIEQPKPKPPQQANLLDFLDDTPSQPIQQQSVQQPPQQFQQQAQIPQQFQQQQQQPSFQGQQQQQQVKIKPADILDAFDDEPSHQNPPQQQYQQPPQQPPQQQFNITQLYQQPQQSQVNYQSSLIQQQYNQQPNIQAYGQQNQIPPQQQNIQITQLYSQPQQQRISSNQPVQVNVKAQSTPFDDMF